MLRFLTCRWLAQRSTSCPQGLLALPSWALSGTPNSQTAEVSHFSQWELGVAALPQETIPLPYRVTNALLGPLSPPGGHPQGPSENVSTESGGGCQSHLFPSLLPLWRIGSLESFLGTPSPLVLGMNGWRLKQPSIFFLEINLGTSNRIKIYLPIEQIISSLNTHFEKISKDHIQGFSPVLLPSERVHCHLSPQNQW